MAELVLNGRCHIGILGPLFGPSDAFWVQPLLAVPAAIVAARTHPLSGLRGFISRSDVADHVQLVVSDQSQLTDGREFGIISSVTWRVSDLELKRDFLRAGFGWGRMPLHMVERDIEHGVLTVLQVESLTEEMPHYHLSSTYRQDAPPGPAGRWLLDQLGAA